MLFMFTMGLFLHAMAAYSIGPVPIEWMAQTGFIALYVYMIFRFRIFLFPGYLIFAVFFIWAIFVSIYHFSFSNFDSFMATGATTGYIPFIFLRFFKILSFLSAVGITYWLLCVGKRKELVNNIVSIGFIIAIYSVYVYIAQVYGLPELPRTRMGTGGGDQNVTFTYAFHRAMGSFREPSHLAEWIVVPLFLSYFNKQKVLNIKSFLMGTTLLLTGSLTGIISSVIGFFTASAITFKLKKATFANMLMFFLPYLVGFFMFSLISISNSSSGSASLIDTLWDRVEPLISGGGVKESNRSYVYEYVDNHSFPVFGQGYGNANILFGKEVGFSSTASFLNLFLVNVYSVGMIGVSLLIIFFAYPYFLHFFKNKGRARSNFVFILAAYNAWVLIFLMHAEELSVFFAIIYALFVYQLKESKMEDGDSEHRGSSSLGVSL
ncbi:MAG: hypothetical protein HOO06_15520 [Bdellovibrionaceae bacterium]|nr:hypothetical protein [Pseudobdellovibrionaceae bacterium]